MGKVTFKAKDPENPEIEKEFILRDIETVPEEEIGTDNSLVYLNYLEEKE